MKKTSPAEWGDMLSSLINLFFTTKGAPSMFRPRAAAQREKERKEKEFALKEESTKRRLDQNDKRIELADRRLQQAADKTASDRQWREEKEDYRRQRDEKNDDYRRQRDEKNDDYRERRFKYQKGKDWISDFYRRNAIYMKTGLKVPANFDNLLQNEQDPIPQKMLK